MFRLLIVSHTYSAQINHAKLEALALLCDLSVIFPHQWNDQLFTVSTHLPSTTYQQFPLPIWLNGRLLYHIYAPHQLIKVLSQLQPHLVFVEEEPHSLALAQVIACSKQYTSRLCAFSWENIFQTYGVPGIHHYIFNHCHGFIAGNQEAAHVLHRKGYQGPIRVIPQLGLDPHQFFPYRNHILKTELELTTFTVGYFGRMVAEKGIWTLLEVAKTLPDVQWLMVGGGPLQTEIQTWVNRHGLETRFRWIETISHSQVPKYLNGVDALVLPSLTTPHWKEQFGHILIEAMACGVPVIGSSSGAIPEVIGDAGLIFTEGNASALKAKIQYLQTQSEVREHLAKAGRARVLAHYTHMHIAQAHMEFFHEVCAG